MSPLRKELSGNLVPRTGQLWRKDQSWQGAPAALHCKSSDAPKGVYRAGTDGQEEVGRASAVVQAKILPPEVLLDVGWIKKTPFKNAILSAVQARMKCNVKKMLFWHIDYKEQ